MASTHTARPRVLCGRKTCHHQSRRCISRAGAVTRPQGDPLGSVVRSSSLLPGVSAQSKLRIRGGTRPTAYVLYCTYSCGLRGVRCASKVRRQGTANVGMQRKACGGDKGGGSSINQSAAWCSTQSSLPKHRHQNFALLTLQRPCRPSLLTLQFNLFAYEGEGSRGPRVAPLCIFAMQR